MLNKRQTAPDFCLPDQNGKSVCLHDFHDKWIVLYFYPKDNTSGCTREAIDFSERIPQFAELNAVIIGISPDSVQSHVNFINKNALQIILLADPEHKVLQEYGVWQAKKLYGRQYFGVGRTTFLIDPQGRIAEIWEKVKVDGHAAAVQCTLETFK
ncbi:MAG: peroxiredoxin [Candidatus Marinimicrobia bacterium]|nr:peroxiredoxin [Candidatus Neomarinimicrobiota bacterium]